MRIIVCAGRNCCAPQTRFEPIFEDDLRKRRGRVTVAGPLDRLHQLAVMALKRHADDLCVGSCKSQFWLAIPDFGSYRRL